jgi:radical SAM superfamily enzyme YgiQ (UPF0313 family)
MTEILLIQSNYKNITQFKKFILDPPTPHIGLSYLTSSLKKHNFNVKIIEGNLFDLSEDDILNLIISESPKVIGITVTTPLLPHVYSLIKKIRLAQSNIKVLKDTTIVLGGPHITFLPESILDIDGDIGCIGESEENFPMLCDYLIYKKGSLAEINGIVYRNNGTINKNEPSEIKDLDSLPFPDYDSFLVPYKAKKRIKLKEFPIMLSRGCVFKCVYCYKSSKRNIRKARYVAEEIEFLAYKYKPKLINFFDDAFTINKKEVFELAKILIERKIKTDWYCSTRADCIDKELLTYMHLAGCQAVFFGVESGSERIRATINKPISDDNYIKVFNDCRKIGIRTLAFFMLGLPTETREDIDKTMQFAKRLNPNHICVSLTTIMPGSYLHNESINKGLLDRDYWKRFMTGEEKMLPIYIPSGMSLREIQAIQIKIFLTFYFFNPKHLVKEIFNFKGFSFLIWRLSNALLLLRQIIFKERIAIKQKSKHGVA